MSFIKFLFTKDFLKQLLYTIIILVVLCFVMLWWLRMTTNHGQKIEVPSLAKMTVDEAANALDELDLTYEVLDSTNYNPSFPYKTVIEQIPDAGKFVKEDRKIYISLNRSGYPMIAVPKVVGKTKRQAEPTLLATGFKIGKIKYERHIAKDELLEIRYKNKAVKAGDKIMKTSTVDLILGDGKGGLNRASEEEDEKETQEGDGGN